MDESKLGRGIDALIPDDGETRESPRDMPPVPPGAARNGSAAREQTRIPVKVALGLIGAGVLGTIVVAALALAGAAWFDAHWNGRSEAPAAYERPYASYHDYRDYRDNDGWHDRYDHRDGWHGSGSSEDGSCPYGY